MKKQRDTQTLFGEKSFEQPLLQALIASHPQLFSPGRILEERVGYDVAVQCTLGSFWSSRGIHCPPGYPLGTLFNPSKKGISETTRYRFNLFVQCKSPEYLDKADAREWKYWEQPYYRFDLTLHQQKTLEKLADRLGYGGLVLYAVPTFHTLDDLIQHTLKGNLISNINFPEVRKLSRHYRYTYTRPGCEGIALSGPTKIRSYSLEEDLPQLVRQSPYNTGTVFEEAAACVEDIVSENHCPGLTFRSLTDSVEQALKELNIEPATLLVIRRFLTVSIFCSLARVAWIIAGE